MPVTFSILDESTAGHRHDAGPFACDSDFTTLREIIRVRAKQEVERFNRTDATAYDLLVQPEEAERLLNGVRLAPETQVTFLKLVPLVGG